MADLGNQHNNGPHQDQDFDNPAVLLALWAKHWIWLQGRETEAPNRLVMRGIFFPPFFFLLIYSDYSPPDIMIVYQQSVAMLPNPRVAVELFSVR